MSTMRKIGAAVAAILCAAALSLAGAPAANASVHPVNGSYNGVDHHGRVVTFSFNGNSISHFRVGSIQIGAAHVSHGRFGPTCGGGYCIKGHWETETHVKGYWQQGGSHTWTSFEAATTAFRPWNGNYSGSDHSHHSIRFSYSHGTLSHFTWNGLNLGSVHVDSTWHFTGRHGDTCFRGHWQSAYSVVGEVRSCHQSHGTPWDANAYSLSS